MQKRGQGLPLNTIIIAIIVLVVLVVLVAIFTGKIGGWSSDVDKQSGVELLKYKASYGKCHPNANAEQNFLDSIKEAQGDTVKIAIAKSVLQQDIQDCAKNTDDLCRSVLQCTLS